MTAEQRRTMLGMRASMLARPDAFGKIVIRDDHGHHWQVRPDGRIRGFGESGYRKPPIPESVR